MIEAIDWTGNGSITKTYVNWRLSRTGEIVLWGRGTIHIDSTEFSDPDNGYTLEITGRGLARDDFDHGYWALVQDYDDGAGDPNNYAGFAVGEMNRKMVPEYSPDITAVKLNDTGVIPDEDAPAGGEDDA